MSTKNRTVFRTAALCAALSLATGCSALYHREKADRVAYGIVKATSGKVAGMPKTFTIERPAGPATTALPEGPVALAKALEIATLNSREYQSRKEGLFLEALSLAGTIHDYQPNAYGTINGAYADTDTSDEREISGGAGFGFGWLLRTGANFTVDLTTTASKLLTGDRTEAAGSLLSMAITQPLLRGFGVTTNEALTQARRNMVYAMRDFVRFRRTFFVGIVSDYYRVLQQATILENERRNYDNLTVAHERARLYYEAERLARFEVDRTNQDVLSAKNRLERAQQDYRAALDSFKVTLGLRTEVTLTLDPDEQQKLTDTFGEMAMELTADQAAEIALANRLDLMTTKDRIEDAERAVKIAKLNLLPGLDVRAAAGVDTAGTAKPTNFRSERTDFEVGLELELPLDRADERNSYRASLVSMDRARRNYEEARDSITLDVRNAWRQYHRARASYRIQQESVRLARTRVESAEMLFAEERGTNRDMLEARQDLLEAENSLAEELVACRLAGLALARDMGILGVGDDGQLKESFDAYEERNEAP